MLNIAVCDDNPAALQEMESLLKRDDRVETIMLYEEPEALCADVRREWSRFDAVLMDIELGEDKTSFPYVQAISNVAPELPVIYVTGYNDRYAQLVFLTDTAPAGYITKPVSESILRQYLDRLVDKSRVAPALTFSQRGKELSVSPEQILYLESRNHAVVIRTGGGEFLVYEKLSSFSDRLPTFFIQCHKSFIVNMKKIARLDTGRAILSDRSVIPISKSRQQETRRAFLQYVWQTL